MRQGPLMLRAPTILSGWQKGVAKVCREPSLYLLGSGRIRIDNNTFLSH